MAPIIEYYINAFCGYMDYDSSQHSALSYLLIPVVKSERPKVKGIHYAACLLFATSLILW